MRNVLFLVTGMTPQIITETLYGIFRQDPAKYPSSFEVITTGEGRERLVAAFDVINDNFKSLFEALFGGGQAEL